METCEHGAGRERHKSYGDVVFACPLGTCSCCGTIFPFIDSEFITWKDGIEIVDATKWEPEDRCGPCGGEYVQKHEETLGDA